jgi:hypothetical protein
MAPCSPKAGPESRLAALTGPPPPTDAGDAAPGTAMVRELLTRRADELAGLMADRTQQVGRRGVHAGAHGGAGCEALLLVRSRCGSHHPWAAGSVPPHDPLLPAAPQIFSDASLAISVGRAPNSRACKYALNCLMNIFSSPGLPAGVGPATLHRWAGRNGSGLGQVEEREEGPPAALRPRRPLHTSRHALCSPSRLSQAGASAAAAAGGRAAGEGARGRGAAQGEARQPPAH